MNRLALAFFTAAAVAAMAGMLWGVVMGATHDHSLSPAHAHLNLLGWATLALMGTFYALTGRAGRLGWINFGLSTLGVAVMIPTLALRLGGDAGAEPGVIAGSLLAVLGMATFLVVVLSSWRRATA
ncbi:hypothetical protein [Phenylobacterium sp.]|jgi:hypothetical protein|uniref:hypothetical protein n=1 Tax=Phenylobacterium sp. TaxID=1871053 RepID=UPI003782D44E